MNNNYFSPVIVKYEEKSLVIVNIVFHYIKVSLYQQSLKHVCKVLARKGSSHPLDAHFWKKYKGNSLYLL